MPIVMMVHGGAWATMPDDVVEAHADGCQTAVKRGFNTLQKGGEALDAVESAIRVLEDDPTFDAGYGSFPTLDGEVELDASLMDGAALDVGAVACVVGVRQPIRLARLVLQSPQVLLAGEGASRFAQENGLPMCSSTDLLAPEGSWHNFGLTSLPVPRDTVGTVALDAGGNIVAGLSTGGAPNRIRGRVGDVPQVGCGYYADNRVGGIACSGWGEAIARIGLAHRAMYLLEAGRTPQEAATEALQILYERVGGYAGLLVVNPQGQVGIAFNTQRFARAYIVDGMEKPFVAVDPC